MQHCIFHSTYCSHVGSVQCGDPGTPQNGNRTVHGTRDGRTVMYTCDEGYSLQGNAYRTCSSSGEWSGELPLCTSELVHDCTMPGCMKLGGIQSVPPTVSNIFCWKY